MNAKVEINGDTGVAVNAEGGAIINIHVMNGSENKPDPFKRAVHVLLKTCDEANCRAAIERISQTLYGSAIFKDLTLDELAKLQSIADEFKATLLAQQVDDHALFMKEMDEYEDFLRRTGIRASKQERSALTQLMVKQAFNPRQIKKAWLSDVLFFEEGKLQVRLPIFEPLVGITTAILGAISLILLVLKILLIQSIDGNYLMEVLQFVLLIAMLIFCAKTMIAPACIGKRIKAVLANTLT
jgi:hypothetical protein